MAGLTFADIKDRLKFKTVGIAGAGGLGSNCAVALARVGIGKLVIADFDSITESNLNRQYYFHDQVGKKKVYALRENLVRVNPSIRVEIHDSLLNRGNIPSIFASCHLIVEALDQAVMKQMIIETVLLKMPGIPLVVGSGLAGWGDTNTLRVRKIDNLYICGDEQTETSEQDPPLAPRVGIVANMQANQVLEILLNS
jgi:sulfur carrier protein ThiS adenylyltransferase